MRPSSISDYFLIIQYIDRGTLFSAETFRIFQWWVDLSVGKISGQNFVIWFFAQYQKNCQKFSRKPRTRLETPGGPNHLMIIVVLWPPSYGQNINSKAIGQMVTFPLKCLFSLNTSSYTLEIHVWYSIVRNVCLPSSKQHFYIFLPVK